VIEYRIKGGSEVAALIAQLPIEIEQKILRNGLAAGANVIRDEAKSLAPKKSGELADDIKTTRGTGEGYVYAKIRLSGKHAFLGRFMEYGVAPHQIWARSKESLVINGVPIGKRVWHPGLAPRPFMRPALDARAGEAVQAVADYLTRYLKWGPITAPTVSVDQEAA
jgi:HK97 gp10 family phage protein